MTEKYSAVPFFELYGEHKKNSDPGFVHIEDIATRSQGLDWVIKAHRHNRLFQVLCIFEADMEIQLDSDIRPLQGSWAVTIPVGVVHGFRFQPNTQGFVLSITDSVLTEGRETGFGRLPSELFQVPQLIHLVEDDRHCQQFLQYIELIREEFSSNRADQDQSLALLSRLVLLSLNRQLQQKQMQAVLGQKDTLVLGKFRQLLEQHYREHWGVAAYAEALHISTSTLNRLCHQSLGSGPKQIIQDRVMTEAKRRLVYTRQSLEELSHTLGFKDYPYFSRFFKKLAGVTAGTYRKQADEQRLSR